ncbi:MAG: YebC/PmpR family DNA-binding transcriptional regulator [Gammaproteobacteria bacterium]|nr:YebC/PmpR family DNA-binding transcriptional regulator [Thiotrichales bacterium]OUX50038.1 MAG: YebC/PmpR family DNA-binding transcriptional regulator [Methylococcaceae bacterium TMED282]
MAGHSKWANIRHKKGKTDAKRGKLFTRLIREVTVAARLGGADAASNPRLRAAIDTALSANMPKDTIERAAARGAGNLDSDSYEELRYEGYGPNGVAIVVDCMTDNRNRTVADVRHAFTKHGGNLGTDGSVSYLFKKVGLINVEGNVEEEALMEVAIDAGAEDVVQNEDGSYEITTAWEEISSVNDVLVSAGYDLATSEVTMQAETTVSLGQEAAESMLKFLDALEEIDDVQKVYSNAEISVDVLTLLNEY